MSDHFAYLIQDKSGLFLARNLTLAPRSEAVMGTLLKVEQLAMHKYGLDWEKYATLVKAEWPEWTKYKVRRKDETKRKKEKQASEATRAHLAALLKTRASKRIWFTHPKTELRCTYRLKKNRPLSARVAICARSARHAAKIGRPVTHKATVSLLWRLKGWAKRKPFMNLLDDLGVWVEYPVKGWTKVL